MKIVSDSSSNVFALAQGNYTTVPLKINAGDLEVVDVPGADVAGMVEYLKNHKGKSGSSCPNMGEWLQAFGTGEDVFALTISSQLSGSYNAACQAAREWQEENPGRNICVFDSKSAGPEMAMIADKLQELIHQGLAFDEVKAHITAYADRLHIAFCLESMMNLARNGRVNVAVAKLAGMLGIRVVGAAEGGQIIPLHKPRGEKKAIQALVEMMVERGLADGALVRIAHCFAPNQAENLKKAILEQLPHCRFIIEPTTVLCSFYAEEGGLMIGYEGGYNEKNHQ